MSKLPIPDKCLEQHTIALGKTGSGKSSTLRLIVEHLLDKENRVVVITAKADWWGLKLAADGKHAGYPVVIFGGEHSDMPLNYLSGKTMAELIGTGNRSAVLQMRDFMPSEREKFWTDFAMHLFRLLQGRLFLVIDEVHNFAPKGKVQGQGATMLHWSNKLASEARGLGITLIAASQRPAKVHNDFLTSCETLIAMRVTTHWDADAVKAWISGCGDEKVGKEVVETLAQMKRGDAWAWSPEIEFGPQRVHFPMFSTFDSFKPLVASDVAKLKGWADVNLDEVREKLAAVVKEHEANDPAKLKAKIRELQVELAKKPGKTKEVHVADPRAIEQAVARAVREINSKHAANASAIHAAMKRQVKVLSDIAMVAAKAANAELPQIRAIELPKIVAPEPKPTPVQAPAQRPIRRETHASSNGDGELTPYQLDILQGLAELESIGRSDVPFALAGVAARKSASSSTFEKYRARLQSAGFVSYPRAGRLALTDEGRKIAPAPDAPLTSDEIQQRCLSLVTPYQVDLVKALISVYPRAVSRDELGELAGKQATSSTFEKYVASLRGMEIIDYAGSKMVKAADWLFLE